MFGWLSKLLGLGGADRNPVGRTAENSPPAAPTASEKAEGDAAPAAEPLLDTWHLKPLSPGDPEFLIGLVSESPHTDLQSFTLPDRSFLSFLMRKTHSGEVVIPILPEAAIKIRKLMSEPDAHLSKFVEVFKNDPALTAEVLKVANSPYYGFESPTHDLGQAVLRIGHAQLRSIVLIMGLRSKVLHSGQYRLEGDLLANLALATARVASDLGPELGLAEEEAFTRGLLSHIDLFIILGLAVEFNTMHKNTAITRAALKEAAVRLGPGIMALVAKKWGLDSLGYGGASAGEGEADDLARIRRTVSGLAKAVVETWDTGEPVTEVEGIDRERLKVSTVKVAGKRK